MYGVHGMGEMSGSVDFTSLIGMLVLKTRKYNADVSIETNVYMYLFHVIDIIAVNSHSYSTRLKGPNVNFELSEVFSYMINMIRLKVKG